MKEIEWREIMKKYVGGDANRNKRTDPSYKEIDLENLKGQCNPTRDV